MAEELALNIDESSLTESIENTVPVEDVAINPNATAEAISPEQVEVPMSQNELQSPNVSSPYNIHLNEPYPDLSGIDDHTIANAIDEATEVYGQLDAQVDQSYLDMFNKVSVDLEGIGYDFGFTNSSYNPFPGRATANFDPFNQSSGVPDLGSSNGRNIFMMQSGQKAVDLAGDDPAPGYQDPYTFGVRRFELDRFYRHPNFQELGFHPFANNDAYYQANSSYWDNFARTRGQWSAMFGTAFTSGWRSMEDWFTGDIAEPDYVGARKFQDAHRIGRSSSGGHRAFWNDLFLNSAYTAGIISSMAVEEAVLWGAATLAAPSTAGGSLGAKALGTAKNVQKLSSLGRASKMVGDFGRNIRNTFNTLKNIDSAKTFYAAARAGGKNFGNALFKLFAPETLYQWRHIKTAATRGENLTNMAKTSRYFGGFYRDFRSVNLAIAEGKLEAGLSEEDFQDELYIELKNELGRAPNTEELDLLNAQTKAHGFNILLLNVPLIYATNKLVLDGALRGFRPMGRLLDETMDGPLSRIMRNPREVAKAMAGKKGAKVFYDAGDYYIGNTIRRMWAAGASGSLKHMAGTMLRYSTANLTEGFQELGQEAIVSGSHAYYKSLFDAPIMGSMEAQLAGLVEDHKAGIRRSNMDVMEAIKTGITSQMSGQGLKTFLSGFMMGGLIQGPQKILFQGMPNLFNRVFRKEKFQEYKQQKAEYVESVVNALNEIYNDPKVFFDQSKLSMAQQKELNQKLADHSYSGNILEFMDTRDHIVFDKLNKVLSAGMMHEFRSMIENAKSLSDEDIKKFFGNNGSSAANLRKKADQMLDRMNRMEKGYEKFKDKFVNPFDTSKYKKGTREYQAEAIRSIAFEHAKMLYMFTQDTFDQSIIRSNEIFKSLSSDPIISKMSSNEINTLMSRKGLIKEIELLRGEILLEANTPEEKEINKEKKKRLKILTKFYNTLYDPKLRSKNGKTFLKKNMSKLKPVFVEYLNHIAETNDDFVNIDMIDDVMKKIIDHGALKGRAQDYHQALTYLTDPNSMIELADRMTASIRKIWETHKDKNEISKRIKKYVAEKERIMFLQKLSDKGIQPDKDQVVEFLETGKLPTRYLDEQGLITKETDPTSWEIIQGYERNYTEATTEEEAAVGEDEFETPSDVDGGDPSVNNVDEVGEIQVPVVQEEGELTPAQERAAQYNAALMAFFDADIETQKLIKDAHEKYKQEYTGDQGNFLLRGPWMRSEKGGAPILRSRFELFKLYETEVTAEDRESKDFSTWLVENTRNPLVNNIMEKHGVTISDISYEKSKQPGIKKDKVEYNQETKETNVPGVNIVKTKVIEDGGQETFYWEVVDDNNDNLSLKHKELDPDGKVLMLNEGGTFTTEKQAMAAVKWLKANKPESGDTFDLFGQKFKTGDVVENSTGDRYLVRSNSKTAGTFKNLYVVPLNKLTEDKDNDGRRNLTKDNWTSEKFEIVNEDQAKLTDDLTTKISPYEAVNFYGFDGSKVKFGRYEGMAASDDPKGDFQRFLRALTPGERKKLKILVEKNPEYEIVQQEQKAGKFRDYRVNPGYKVNPGLAAGANEFEITLLHNNKPVAKLVGLGLTTLRDGKNIIDGARITKEQADRLFIIENPTDYQKIRNRYSSIQGINNQLRKKLKNKQDGIIALSSLKDVDVVTSEGWAAYKETVEVDGKEKKVNASTPWDQLEQKTFDDRIIIYDVHTRYENGKPRVITRSINDFQSAEEQLRIEDEILNAIGLKGFTDIASLGLGRYIQFVKQPDGTITWFKLKADTVSNLDPIIIKLKDQQQKTKKENLKSTGNELVEKTESNNPELYNDKFNTELQVGKEGFYIEGKPGETITLGLDPWGRIQVNYFKKDKGQTIRQNLFIDVEIMNQINTGQEFVDLVNELWKADQQKKANNAKKNKEKYTKVNLKLSTENFSEHIPKNADAAELTSLVRAQIAPQIRNLKNMRIRFNDPAMKSALQGRNIEASEVKETKSQKKERENHEMKEEKKKEREGSVKKEDVSFEDMLNNDFKNVPQELIDEIQQKILNNDKLSFQEQEIVNALPGVFIKTAKDQNEEIINESNKEQVEPGSSNLSSKIKELENRYDELYDKIWNTAAADIQTKNPNMSTEQLNKKLGEIIDNNVELSNLQTQIDNFYDNVDPTINNVENMKEIDEIEEIRKKDQDNSKKCN